MILILIAHKNCLETITLGRKCLELITFLLLILKIYINNKLYHLLRKRKKNSEVFLCVFLCLVYFDFSFLVFAQ